MEEHEFRRILGLFPIVRSRDYCFQDESKRVSSSHSGQDEAREWQKAWSEMDKLDELKENESEDPFWSKLRAAAERKVGRTKAERFCSIFKTLHMKLVYEYLTFEAAQRFVGTAEN